MGIYDGQIDPELLVKQTLSMSINQHLRLRFCCLILLTLNIFLAIIFCVIGYVKMVDVEEILKRDISDELESVKLVMSMNIKSSLNDLFFLSDIVDQNLNLSDGKIGSLTDSTLYNFIKNNDSYDQARFIDEYGMEIIRVNKGFKNIPQVVTEKELQDKSMRPYFLETLNLSTNIAYISALDLNVERGEIEIPYKLVLRMATPVYYKGMIKGILVLNFLGSELLEDAIHILKQGQDIINDKYFLLNSEGEPLAYIEWVGAEVNSSLLGFDATAVFNKTFNEKSTEIIDLKDGIHVKEGYVFAKATIRADATASNSNDKYALVKSNILEFTEHDKSDLILLSVTNINPYWSVLKDLSIRNFLIILWAELIFIFIASIVSVGMVKQKVLENAIKEAAAYDPLTSIYNRRFGILFIKYEISKVGRTRGLITLFVIDVNNLKKVNDTCGHSSGDELLKLVAQRLTHEVREYDIVCRIGGDEFVVAFSGMGLEGGNTVIERVRSGLVEDYKGRFNGVGVDFSYGGVTYNAFKHKNFEDFMSAADAEMYEDKKRRKQGRI